MIEKTWSEQKPAYQLEHEPIWCIYRCFCGSFLVTEHGNENM